LGRILSLGDKTKEVQILGRIFGENGTKLPYFKGKKVKIVTLLTKKEYGLKRFSFR
jgi:hypothetical protein